MHYEDLGFTPEEIAMMAKFFKEQTSVEAITADMKIVAKLAKLEKYEKLAEQGRLITLPCSVGDTVYGVVWENCHNGKCPWLDTTGKCTKGGIFSEYCPQEVISWEFSLEDLYNPRRFYLTLEEAEAALKGAEDEV